MNEQARRYIEQRIKTDRFLAFVFGFLFVGCAVFAVVSKAEVLPTASAAWWGGIWMAVLLRLAHSRKILRLDSGCGGNPKS